MRGVLAPYIPSVRMHVVYIAYGLIHFTKKELIMPYLPRRFTKKEMTDYVVTTIVQGSNAITGSTLDWKNFAIRVVFDPLSAHEVGRVSGERRCVYDVYPKVEGIGKTFRCYMKPDRLTYIGVLKEDIVHHNNPNPLEKIYHLEVRMDERIFPSVIGPRPLKCPDFRDPSDDDDSGALLQENGGAILQENGAALLP